MLKKIIKIPRTILADIFVSIILLFTKKFFFLIGRMNSKSKISHLVSYSEPMLRKYKDKNYLIIIIDPGNRSINSFLWKKYSEIAILIGFKKKIIRFIYDLIFFLLLKETKYDLKLKDFYEVDYQYLFNDYSPVVKFSNEEDDLGTNALNKMKLKKTNFICFGIREATYYSKTKADDKDSGINTFHRNPDPKNYIKFIDYFCNKSISIVRAGVSAQHNYKNQPGYFDYCNSNYRNDFLDFYLQANSKFVVAGACGLHLISAALNKPSVETDTYMLWGGRQKFDLFIPRLIINNKTKKILSFKEMMDLGQKYLYEENCIKDDVSFIPNTPEEILDVCIEMNNRLDGTWIDKDDDLERQLKFKKLFPPKPSSFMKAEQFFYKKNVKPAGNIGSSFLKKYQYLLK